ncbi:hypothetical protein BV20DRAFT_1052885 [Pilatotrama ljubarskyi]|nr:hypothetical protein BV20DRAFT_1052885 [Pilatotrama ljubarskyi]
MGKFYDSIPPEIIPWLRKQEQFWVATAPLSAEGHVNVSPKGVRDSFHIISATRVWYQDLTGSGVETIAHLRENGRITLMFSAFEGPPRIVRLFGTGTVHEFGTPEYDALIPHEKRRPGSRSAIVVDVHKVGTSCGYAVPYYDFKGHRQIHLPYGAKLEQADRDAGGHSDKGLKAYWANTNARSIDGLPGVVHAHKAERVPDSRDVMKRADASEDGEVRDAEVKAGKTSGGVLVKYGLERRRVEEWAVAFALGLAVAAIYVQVTRLT